MLARFTGKQWGTPLPAQSDSLTIAITIIITIDIITLIITITVTITAAVMAHVRRADHDARLPALASGRGEQATAATLCRYRP